MKLFNIIVLTTAVIAGKGDGRNEDVPDGRIKLEIVSKFLNQI